MAPKNGNPEAQRADYTHYKNLWMHIQQTDKGCNVEKDSGPNHTVKHFGASEALASITAATHFSSFLFPSFLVFDFCSIIVPSIDNEFLFYFGYANVWFVEFWKTTKCFSSSLTLGKI